MVITAQRSCWLREATLRITQTLVNCLNQPPKLNKQYQLFTDIFLNSREVERSLSNHETHKCLLWCHDNKSKLRKLKSSMEFNLRIQEFIELIRKDRRIDAIKHSRKHFPGFEEEHLPIIQVKLLLYFFLLVFLYWVNVWYIRKHCWSELRFHGKLNEFVM